MELECTTTLPKAPAMARRRKAPAKIEVRHEARCAVTAGGTRCSCDPSYRARAWDPITKQRIRKTFHTVTAAEEWLEQAEAAIRRGVLRAEAPITLRDAAEKWIADAEAGVARTRSGTPYKPSAVRSYREALHDRILPRLGAHRLRDIRRRDLQAFVDELVRDGLAPQTVRNMLLPLRVVFRRAIALGDVEANPTMGLHLPAPSAAERKVVTPEHARSLVEAITDARDRAIYATALFTGLRRGELMALRWQDIDVAGGVLSVTRAWDPKERAYVAPKSARGTRKVGIPLGLVDHLHAWKATCAWADGLAFGESDAWPFRDDALATRVARDWKAAGLDGLTLHECRHTFVTWMAESGVAVDVVQRVAGHSSITITMDRYRHALERTTTQPADELQAWIDDALAPKPDGADREGADDTAGAEQ